MSYHTNCCQQFSDQIDKSAVLCSDQGNGIVVDTEVFQESEKNGKDFLMNLQSDRFSSFVTRILAEDNNSLSFEDIDLDVATSALQLFIQYNWTGPIDNNILNKVNDILTKACSSNLEEVNEKSMRELGIDGETVYEGIRLPSLLLVARKILGGRQRKSIPWLIWQLRSVFIHQSMIEERCHTLKCEAMLCINTLMHIAGIPNGNTDGEEAVNSECVPKTEQNLSYDTEVSRCMKCGCRLKQDLEWRLSASYISRNYFEHQTCKKLLEDAVKVSNLTISFDGIPGKRTKYQYKDIAQLLIKVTSNSEDGSYNQPAKEYIESCAYKLPKNEPLCDDTVLDKMKFTDYFDDAAMHLSGTEQALLLALCEENKYVKAEDGDITDEETLAYTSCILSDPKDWSVQAKALLIRSLTEKKSGRRIERSLRQLEELSQAASGCDTPDTSTRAANLYSTALPPIWQRALGELHMEVGAYASAMEVFDRLCLWDPLIVCSQRAGRTGKAEELIRQRLAKQETAALFCSLSDVTGDIQYYNKAWELSNHRSARAMRGLAYHHLRACQYEEAMECFEKSLAINPLQLPCWFSYGCSSLAAQCYDKAATAFRRCVTLESDNYEAWNNLAAAYARSKQKLRAFAVLQDAIKCSYDNWRIWENFVLLAADCGEVSEVIKGGHRILELKDKWQDEQVVEHITKMVIDDIEDAHGKPSSVHRKSLLQLLGHVTAKVTTNSRIWRSYGRLIFSDDNQTETNLERGIQCVQKAYRCGTNESNWDKDMDKCKQNTELLLELVQAYEKLGTKKYISTAKLQIKGHIAKLLKSHTDPVSKEVKPEVNELINSLENALTQLPQPTD